MLWLPAPVWDCVPHPDTRREAVQGTESASPPCCRQFSSPVVRASGSLGSAGPQECWPLGAARVPEPPALFPCVCAALAPPPRGRGAAGRSGRAAPVVEAGTGQGRRPALFLKAGPGRQRPGASGAGRERRPAAGGRNGAERSCRGGGCERGRLRCPAPRRGPGGGMAALPWRGFAVR